MLRLWDAGGGLLEEHLGALTRRLADLTKHQRLNLGEAASRLRFPAIAAPPAGPAFGPVASATLPDAWADNKDALRSFAIDRIRCATVLPDTALDIPEAQLDGHYASAYGIFGGKADKVAVLVFTAERARWVADERWHPQQEGRRLEDGRYELRIPYRKARELVLDVLRHGTGGVMLTHSDLTNSL